MEHEVADERGPHLRPQVIGVVGIALTLAAVLLLQFAFAGSGSSSFAPGGLDGVAAAERCSARPTFDLRVGDGGVVVDVGRGGLSVDDANTRLAELEVPLVLRFSPEHEVESGSFLVSSNDGVDGRGLALAAGDRSFFVPDDLSGRHSAVFACTPLD